MTQAPSDHPAVPPGDKLKKKPIYKRVWFWLLAIVLLIVVISAMSGGGDESSGGSVSGEAADPGSDTPAGPTFAGQQEEDTVAEAGQSITLEDVVTMATPLAEGQALGTTPVLCSTVTIVNNGDEAASFNGGFDWKLQDPQGASRGTTLGGDGEGDLGGHRAASRAAEDHGVEDGAKADGVSCL